MARNPDPGRWHSETPAVHPQTGSPGPGEDYSAASRLAGIEGSAHSDLVDIAAGADCNSEASAVEPAWKSEHDSAARAEVARDGSRAEPPMNQWGGTGISQ